MKQATQAEKVQEADNGILDWIGEKKIANEKGDPIEFDMHPFLLDIYDDQSQQLTVMKAAQVGMCLHPNNRVLTSSLEWVRLEDMKVGQKIVATNESHGGNSRGRKLLVAQVEAKNEVYENAIALTLQDGRVITATPEHRFLSRTRPNETDTVWRFAKDFKLGDCMRHVIEPWGNSSFEDGWLGGIIDGEGHLRKKKAGCDLNIVQRPGLVLDRVREYMRPYAFREDLRDKKGISRNLIGSICVSRTDEVMRIVGMTRPSRYIQTTYWWEGISLPGNTIEKTWPKVVKIELLPKQRMIDLQTTSKTFIVEGVVSHNSTLQVLKNHRDAKRYKMDIIYTLPTDQDVRIFVGGKVNRIIANNKSMIEDVADKDSIEQKQIGNSMEYFRGTWSKKAAIMVTADRLVHDEKDSSKLDVVAEYQARLQHSKYKQIHTFSHPSLPETGVHADWLQSDQKHWFIKCRACEKWQYLSWNTEDPRKMSVDFELRAFVCKKCHAVFSDADRASGQWVAKDPGKKWSGYWVPLLICPWVSAGDIIDKFQHKDTTAEFFYTKILGLPFADGSSKLLRKSFLQNLTGKSWAPHTDERVVLGIDTGLRLDYVLGNKKGLFFQGDCDNYDALDDIMKRWPKCIAIIDSGGDLIGSRAFAERWPGRVFLCSLTGDRHTKELTKWGKNDEQGAVSADRNRMIQLVVDEFRNKRIPVHGTEEDWFEYWLDWNNLSKIKVLDPDTNATKGYKWVRSARDHRALATVFWRVGMMRFAGMGVILSPTLTPKPNSYMVNPDNTVDFNPNEMFDRIEEEEDGDDWRAAV